MKLQIQITIILQSNDVSQAHNDGEAKRRDAVA